MGVNATDSIRHQQEVDKKKQELQAELLKKRNEELKEQEAQKLVTELAGGSNAKSYGSFKDDINEDLKTFFDNGQIKKELYEEAKEYLESKEYKKQKEEEFKSEARRYVAHLTSSFRDQGITHDKDLEKAVRNELKDQLENGKITEEQYKAYNKFAKRKGAFARFFGAKENEAIQLYRGNANRNKVDVTREKFNKDEIQLDPELQAKLELAGISIDDAYEIYDANGGAADGTINYSYKKVQPGERDGIYTYLNGNEKGVEFSMNDVKDLGRALGYTVEKKVDAGQVVKDTTRGLLIGSPASYVNMKQAQYMPGVASQVQSINLTGIIPGVTAATGGIYSAISQAHRVEDRALPTNVPEGVKTYEQYAKYLDGYSTERGAAIGKDIAKYYTDEEGNLNIEEMNRDLSRAAGTNVSISTPLNYEEALVLLGRLEKKPPRPVPPEEHPDTTIIDDDDPFKLDMAFVIPKSFEETVEAEKECYQVKFGDTWDAIVRGKYQPKTNAEALAIRTYVKTQYYEANKEKLNDQGIKSPKAAFFPPVGTDLCLPKEIEINGKTYNYITDGKIEQAAFRSGNIVSMILDSADAFTNTVKGTNYSILGDTGNVDINNPYTSKNAAQNKVNEIKNENRNTLIFWLPEREQK